MRYVMGILCGLCSAGPLGCGDDGPGNTLEVSWAFEAGDCASNGVDTVEVTWTGPDGVPQREAFDCLDGMGALGAISTGGESYSIAAVGLDAAGNERAKSFGTSVSFHGGVGGPVDVTLHPSDAALTVSWSLGGGGPCPPAVVLPYFITVFEAPASSGDPLQVEVASMQETCSAGSTVLQVPPGSYVVEVDSRAVTPAVRGTAEVTVDAGEPSEVEVTL